MSTILERQPETSSLDRADGAPSLTSRPSAPLWIYVPLVIAGLLLLDVFGGAAYAGAVATLTLTAILLMRAIAGTRQQRALLWHRRIDRQDLATVLVIYVASVALFRVAFSVF